MAPTAFVPTNDGNFTVVISNPAGSISNTWTITNGAPGMVEAWGANGSGECNRPILTNAAGIAAGEYQSVAVTDTGSVLQWGKYSNSTTAYSVTNTTVATQAPTSGVVAVSAGLQQGLALMTNGTVYSWGLTSSYGVNLATNQYLTNITAVSCGWQYDLALTSSGTVQAWGDNTYGQTNLPANLTNVTAIAAGPFHAVAILSNGSVVSWGSNPDGETNVITGGSNAVAIAAGLHHSLALWSSGNITAWGDNTYGQCTVPTAASQSNVMAIAAGDYHSAALLNNGTIVEWGLNTSNQTTVPLPYPGDPSLNNKLIVAGGNHSMSAIFSPLVQYPINVANDLLLVYCSNAVSFSSNICTYYRNNRPMVANANVLGINCPTNEEIPYTNYTATFVNAMTNWLTNNPTKRPQYVILFQDLPKSIGSSGSYTSVQYDLNCGSNTLFNVVDYPPSWHPFVTSINMDYIGGGANCTNYINKLTDMAGNNKILFISASAHAYNDINWYFDDTNNVGDPDAIGLSCVEGVTDVNPTASIFTTVGPSYVTSAANVAGYYTCGLDCAGGNWASYAINSNIVFNGSSGWYVMSTTDSFNGQTPPMGNSGQWSFVTWFSSNSFGSPNNYTNTPVGAVVHVQEPGSILNSENRAIYFGDWAAGWSLAISAWNSFYFNSGNYYECAAVGDPFVTK
jgi:hypothetical protein